MSKNVKPKYKSSNPIVYNPDGYDASGFLESYKFNSKGKKIEPKYRLKPLPKKPNKKLIVLGKLSVLLVLYIQLIFIIGIAIPTFSVEGILFDVPKYVTKYIEGPLNSLVEFLSGYDITHTIFIKPMDFIVMEYSTYLTKFADDLIMQYLVAGVAIIGLFFIDYVVLRLFYYRYNAFNNLFQMIIKILFIFNLIAIVCTVSYYDVLAEAGVY